MLDILAVLPDEGWAFVRDGVQTLLIRPPYTRAGRRSVDADEVGRAVAIHGFSVPQGDCQFPGWSSLVAHLNAQVEQSRAQQGQRLEAVGLGERLLPHAPAPILERFLDRVEGELLPNPESWAAASRLLLAMLPLPRVRESSSLSGRAVGLLSRLVDSQSIRKTQFATQIMSIDQQFPCAAKLLGAGEISGFRDEYAHQPSPMGI